MPDIADNTDDFIRLLIRGAQPETLPERIFAGKEAPREQLADEDHFRITAHFRLRERAAVEQRDVHGAKIIVIHVANVSVGTWRGIRRRAPLNIERKVGGLSG